MEDDRRKLKLANHVIKEMKKIADTGPNKSHSKGIIFRKAADWQGEFQDFQDFGTQ